MTLFSYPQGSEFHVRDSRWDLLHAKVPPPLLPRFGLHPVLIEVAPCLPSDFRECLADVGVDLVVESSEFEGARRDEREERPVCLRVFNGFDCKSGIAGRSGSGDGRV